MKEVHKASKKAKIFETQKVIKKLKDLEFEPNLSLLILCGLNVSVGKKTTILRLSENTKQN